MWEIPQVSAELQNICKRAGATYIKYTEVDEYVCSLLNSCHTNVDDYIDIYGGYKITGSYILKHQRLSIYQFIKHSIWTDGKRYVDITPYIDNRNHNIFVDITPIYYNTYYQSPHKYNKQEIDNMYYVYLYTNPETNEPMYVGKGTQNRAFVHLFDTEKVQNNRFRNKIKSLKSRGVTPTIEFLAQNIEDEDIAYEIEEDYIRQYGRIGYDENGVLLNICESSHPPNHKGKTYKDIYGDRWEEQIEKRRKIQLDCGGFGPKHHSNETKQLFSKQRSGKNNNMFGKHYSDEAKQKISKVHKGKRNKNAFKYIFMFNDNIIKTIVGSTDAVIFCSERNISWSTLWKRNHKNMVGPCLRGKTKNWKLIIQKN